MMAEAHPHRPLPKESHPCYWMFRAHYEALHEHRIVVQACAECRSRYWPPQESCRRCGHQQFEVGEVASQGVIYTFSIVHKERDPWFGSNTPYGVAVVEVAQGIRIVGSVFGDDVNRLACGVVAVAEIERVDDTALIRWRI